MKTVMRYVQILQEKYKSINTAIALLSGFFGVGCMILVFSSVVMRYFVHKPITGTTELSTYILIYMGFLPLAWILNIGGHVSVDVLTLRLRGKLAKIKPVFQDIVGLCYCIPMTWMSWTEAWDSFNAGARFTGELDIPQFPVAVVIPFGFSTISLQFLLDLVVHIAPYLTNSEKTAIDPSSTTKTPDGNGRSKNEASLKLESQED